MRQGRRSTENLVSPVSIVETCPEVDFPANRPASAIVTSGVQGDGGRLGKLGCDQWSNLSAGIDREQIREVTVLIFRIVYVFHPFLKLPPFPNLWPEETGAHVGDVFPEFFIDTKIFGGFNVVSKKIIHQLIFVGIPLRLWTMLWGDTRRTNKFAVWQFDCVVFPELTELFDYRVGRFLKVVFIARVGIMIPNILR